MPPICDPTDVCRVLGRPEPADVGPIVAAIETATSWAKRYLRDPGLGAAAGSSITSFYDVREDGDIPVYTTVTLVEAVDQDGGRRTLTSSDYTISDGRLRFRPHLGSSVDVGGSVGVMTERVPRSHYRIDVTSNRAATVDPVLRDGVAMAAGAIWTRSPRNAKGLRGESLGDYSYTVAQQVAGDPFFEEAKTLLRPLRRRTSLVP